VLLERHGVLTRAAAPAEGVTSRFRDVYRVLRVLEERGAVRRGYFVEGLGGSQFALPGAVDQLRTDAADRARARDALVEGDGAGPGSGGRAEPGAVLLAATDPANPYGAAVAWPRTATPRAGSSGASVPGAGDDAAGSHRPGRKAGAVVVLVDGELVLFVERGGRTVLSFGRGDAGDGPRLAAAARLLVTETRADRLGRVTVQRVDGVPALTAARDRTPAAAALLDAGFGVTPRGLRPA